MCEKLKKYCEDNDIDDKAGGDANGVNDETFRLWRTGGAIPRGRDKMNRLCEWTGWIVQPNDFFSVPDSVITDSAA